MLYSTMMLSSGITKLNKLLKSWKSMYEFFSPLNASTTLDLQLLENDAWDVILNHVNTRNSTPNNYRSMFTIVAYANATHS